MKYAMQNKGTKIFAALLTGVIFLSGAASAMAAEEKPKYPILAPCTRDDPAYKTIDFTKEPFKDWPKTYHATVNRIIEDHMKQPTLQCDGDTYQELLEPGEPLKTLARSLAPWQKEEDIAKLKQSDMSLVLIEYLRVYECALLEYSAFEAPLIVKEKTQEAGPGGILQAYTYAKLLVDLLERAAVILSELKTARPTLYYTLNLISSYDRLRPLQAEIECVQRASLDIRNMTALTAEASACLPRVWSTKDPLRDLKK